MRFKSLSEDAQFELAADVLTIVENAPAHFLFPDATPCNWLAALHALNVRIAADGFLTPDNFMRVIAYVQEKINRGESVCTCCG